MNALDSSNGTAEGPSGASYPARRPIGLIAALLLVLLGAYSCEGFPRFLQPSVALPSDDYGESLWGQPTFAVTFSWGAARHFLFSRQATLVYHNAPDADSLSAIPHWFDRELSSSGWTRTEDWTTCAYQLPEARFLPHVPDFAQDGYVSYRREGFIPSLGMEEEDLVCVALWSPDTGVFEVEMLTSKPSPLMIVHDFLGS